jgi:hypothetical protein
MLQFVTETACMGLRPSLYIASCNFTGYSKTDFDSSAYSQSAKSMCPLEFGQRRFDTGSDTVTVLPRGGLLD